MPSAFDDENLDEGEWVEEESNLTQEILDKGYELLDGFTEWLDFALKVETRAAQQDCFNAESYVDYLANFAQLSVFEATEYDLRWFVFSYYIRKSLGDEPTELRLLDSLRRFIEYLRAEHGYTVPEHIYATLEDHAFYVRRRAEYHALNPDDERTWADGFENWCSEMETDLDTRCLWLPSDLGEGERWGDTQGWREAALYREAQRLWLKEREELLGFGQDFDSMREELYIIYMDWLDQPQEKLEDDTPRNVIMAERTERQLHEEDPDDGEDE
ncbi:MAG: hypothetical protein H7308_03000 [Chthonomonadaceae bacterium]|nr:hypothetical protein [Chthonomonadaceae bacterium]